jgi:hypothetical protein
MARSRDAELQSIRDSVAFVGGLSDSIVRIGPFSLGLDGLLAWVPVVGELYSAGAAAFLLAQGVRARVPAWVLLGCAAMMGLRTAVDVAPLAGALAADLFTAHKWSARLIVKAIDKKLGQAAADPADERRRARKRWSRLAAEA